MNQAPRLYTYLALVSNLQPFAQMMHYRSIFIFWWTIFGFGEFGHSLCPKFCLHFSPTHHSTRSQSNTFKTIYISCWYWLQVSWLQYMSHSSMVIILWIYVLTNYLTYIISWVAQKPDFKARTEGLCNLPSDEPLKFQTSRPHNLRLSQRIFDGVINVIFYIKKKRIK